MVVGVVSRGGRVLTHRDGKGGWMVVVMVEKDGGCDRWCQRK